MIDLKALRNVGNLHEFAVLFGFDWDDPDWDWTWHDVAVKMADEIEAWSTRANEPLGGVECYECQNGAPMIPLRTCTMEYQTGADNPKRGWFECSVCGGLSDSVGSGWNGKKKRVNPPKFCAICGAKVVEA